MTPDDVFQLAVDFTIEQETGGDPTGAYHVDPHDPGGATKWGIAKRFWPSLDIQNLTHEQAVGIYRTAYWNPFKCDDMCTATPELAVAVFECAVNPGPGFVRKWLPRVVNKPRPARALLVQRVIYYSQQEVNGEILLRKNFVRYDEGWIGRTLDTYRLCLAIAHEKEP